MPFEVHDRSAPMATAPDTDPRTGTLPVEAHAVALASVPGIGPRTLRTLLEQATARSAWDALVSGRADLPASRQSGAAVGHARRTDVGAVWAAHVRAGIGVRLLGDAGYPAALANDPEAPAVLFSLGNPKALDAAPRVAIVGTRAATRYGLGVAAQLGADLAAAGVVVVSGLALGIDGAAHEGAVAAWRASGTGAAPGAGAPVGVVAGSLSVPYPRQHSGLWRRIAEAGAVISESPIGVADLAWRFPMRNRIIAAISDVVVVVECHTRGGSLHTVQAATARGVPVGAVPGSIRSPASAGTNGLLADGCFVVRDASDVLVAVGLASVAAPPLMQLSTRDSGERRIGVDELPAPTSEILSAVGWEPTSLDEILEQTGLEMDAVCGALERLRAGGLVHGEGGSWERT